jgi:alkylation response protein AidB-like acyl-CoA dehydrogenase
MSVLLTEDRPAIQRLARDFAMKEVLPVADRLDPVAGEIPMELRAKMADLWFFGLIIPEQYGGLGLGVFEYALVAEELSRAWMSVASIITRSQQFGEGWSEQMRARYLRAAARGDYLGASTLSEPGAGSDVAALPCRAVRDGSGAGADWVITGQKMWCTFADGANYLLLFARTDPVVDPKHRSRGISAFMVQKEPGGLPDGIAGSPMRKIGYHGWKTWELSFDGFRIPADSLIGTEERGFASAVGNLEIARIHTARLAAAHPPPAHVAHRPHPWHTRSVRRTCTAARVRRRKRVCDGPCGGRRGPARSAGGTGLRQPARSAGGAAEKLLSVMANPSSTRPHRSRPVCTCRWNAVV